MDYKTQIFSSLTWSIFSHMTRLDQSCANENIRKNRSLIGWVLCFLCYFLETILSFMPKTIPKVADAGNIEASESSSKMRGTSTIASIWCENMLRYFSVDIICSEKRTVWEKFKLRGTDNVQGQISEHIFASNGGYCAYCLSNLFHNTRSFEIPQLGNIRPRDVKGTEEPTLD